MVEEAKRDILEMTEVEGALYMLGLLKEFKQLMGYAWKAERDLKAWFPPGKRHCINGVVLTLEKWSRL